MNLAMRTENNIETAIKIGLNIRQIIADHSQGLMSNREYQILEFIVVEHLGNRRVVMEQGMGLGRVTAARLGDASGTNGFGANGGYGAGDYSAGGYGAGWRRMAARRAEPADGNWEPANNKTEFTIGDRVFHQKFGMGNILTIDGDKLLIAFDKAGHKKVVSGFVSKP